MRKNNHTKPHKLHRPPEEVVAAQVVQVPVPWTVPAFFARGNSLVFRGVAQITNAR